MRRICEPPVKYSPQYRASAVQNPQYKARAIQSHLYRVRAGPAQCTIQQNTLDKGSIEPTLNTGEVGMIHRAPDWFTLLRMVGEWDIGVIN